MYRIQNISLKHITQAQIPMYGLEKNIHSPPYLYLLLYLPIHANYSPPVVALINTEINRNGVVLP